MSLRAKVAGIAALAGFLAVTAWSAVLVPPPCCSPGCEACPVTVCSPAAAKTPSKFELGRVAEIPSPALRSLPVALVGLSLAPSLPAFAPHAFVRPMRN